MTRCYIVPEVLDRLHMSERTFQRLRQQGKLPFLEEIQPRLGRIIRYRADLIDRYLAGEWQRPALVFGRKRRA